MYKGDRSRKETLVEYGFRLPSALDNRPLQVRGVGAARAADDLRLGDAGQVRGAHGGQVVEQVVRPTGLVDPEVEIRPVAHAGRRRAVRDQQARRAQDERVLITTLTKRMAEDLTEYLHEHGVQRALPALRRRDGRAHGDHPRPAARQVRRAGRHQPAARRPRHARGVAGRDSRCGQGRIPALGQTR